MPEILIIRLRGVLVNEVYVPLELQVKRACICIPEQVATAPGFSGSPHCSPVVSFAVLEAGREKPQETYLPSAAQEGT